MNTLTTLIDAYRKAYASAEQSADYVEETYAIADYVLAHAADITERERLEVVVVKAWRYLMRKQAEDLGEEELARDYFDATSETLARYLVAHAETEDV